MTEKLTTPLSGIKEREIEILGLMAKGLTNTEIADQLFVTRETIRWYNKQIYSKLGTSRRTEAIALAQELGVIGEKVRKSEPKDNYTAEFHLPITNGPFVGRDTELADLSSLFNKPKIRLISIIAAGGMGKSRLALEFGHQIKRRFKNGALFIDLTAISNPKDIALLALNSLGLTSSGQDTAQEILMNYCREKELLIIFDNFEHVLDGASILSELLEVGPNLKIIVTTREQLNLRLETAYFLQPIIESGAELFTEIASMMHAGRKIGQNDQVAIQKIVDVVGGLPLALILAATWLDTLTVAEVGAEIEANLDFLSSELQDMPTRQRSMRAVIEPTWNRLSADEQKAFMWSSVFRGGFTREAFQQATGASIRTIQTLLRRSLFHHGIGRRYNLHPLIQQFGFEKLQSAGMVTAAKSAHLKTFLNFAQQEYDALLGKQLLEGIEKYEAEQGNIRAALKWSLADENDVIDGVALTLAMIRFWLDKSQLVEASEALAQALQHQPDSAELNMYLGFCHYRLGDMREADINLHRAIDLAKETGDLQTLANSYRILVPIYFIQKKSIEEILGLLETAIEIGESIGNRLFVARCHDSLGLTLSAIGQKPEKVLHHFEKALSTFEEIGNQRNISSVLYNMANEHFRLRDMKQARQLAEQSLSFMRQLNDKVAISRRVTAIAKWDIVEEEFERAEAYLTEAERLSQEMGDRSRLQNALYVKGILLMIMGDFDQSAAVLTDSVKLAEKLTNLNAVATCHSNLAQLYLMQDEVEKARPHIVKSLETLQDSVFQPWEPMMVYANYLWHLDDITGCAPIVATMSMELEKFERGEAINNQYFLRPLIYRVEQKLGAEGWQAAVQAAEGKTVKQHFEDAIKTVSSSR